MCSQKRFFQSNITCNFGFLSSNSFSPLQLQLQLQFGSLKKDKSISSVRSVHYSALILYSVFLFALLSGEMARVRNIFSLRNLLVLSLALNVSPILKLWNENAQKRHHNSFAVEKRSRGPIMADEGDRVINLDHGDPTMYEQYWEKLREETTIVIPGWQSMSYFSDTQNVCWFLEPEFAKEIVRLHRVVGNAVTDGRHIVVGTGSSQLYLAALYALSLQNDASLPMTVVSVAPFYSSYPAMTDFLKSGLYKWGGDAMAFAGKGPYIELVTSPNNPDGFVRHSTVNRTDGFLVHDLAYYWPQYTPISSPADNDLSLFTVSKSTGHAGMRIGWALVRDEEVAKKMIKFIELNTIGVSKDSQLRAAKVLRAVSDSCSEYSGSFFAFSRRLMEERWEKLRAAVNCSGKFSLPQFSPAYCNFVGNITEPQPAFAWLKCEGDTEDCEGFLRRHKILTRGGRNFGVSPKYVRISMLDRNENFNLFVERLSKIRS